MCDLPYLDDFFCNASNLRMRKVDWDKHSNQVFEFPKEELHQIISITEDEFVESKEQLKHWNELKQQQTAWLSPNSQKNHYNMLDLI